MGKIFNRFCVLCAVSVTLISQPHAYAAGPDKVPQAAPNRSDDFAAVSDEIKLNPEQKDKLTKDRDAYFARTKELKEKIRLARAELKSEFEKPGLDEGKINKIAADIKNLLAQQVQSRVDSIITMKRVMTPEQFKAMTETVKRRGEAAANAMRARTQQKPK